MVFEEKINENGKILFWQPETKYRTNSSLILGMDLDWTIIKPVTGKVFPKDKNDWVFLFDDIPEKLNSLSNTNTIIIFSNQLGILTGKTSEEDIIFKVTNIKVVINIKFFQKYLI
jgi:DNA 3'-phosphatase